jgi:predicted nucleic acid-binding protein
VIQAVTLDAGALIAIERRDPRAAALLHRAVEQGASILIPAAVVAHVWRDGARNARLARLVVAHETTVVPFDLAVAKAVRALRGRRGKRDVVDALVVVCAAEHRTPVVTSDPDDLLALDPTLNVFGL